MTTKELIDLLTYAIEKDPENADCEIWLEGCDCEGRASGKYQVVAPWYGEDRKRVVLLRDT